jgi:hypothetical protein
MLARRVLIQTEVFTNFLESVTEDVSLCERPEAEEKRKPSTRPLTKVLSIADKDECKSIFLTAFAVLGD